MRLAAFALILAAPSVASAHAFGRNYILPLPFHLYATGAVAALVASFAIFSLFKGWRAAPSVTVPVRSYAIAAIVRGTGVALFALTLATAFFGSADRLANPAPILFWVMLWVALTYMSALVSGIARLMNPAETVARILIRRPARRAYPPAFGVWPALAVFAALIWLELLSGWAAIPAVIGSVLAAYLAVSLAGAYVFGVDSWFEHADFFNVFFGLVGRFAPFSFDGTAFSATLPGERLIAEAAPHASVAAFIVFMLAATAYDGLRDTQAWWDLFFAITIHPGLFALQGVALLVLMCLVFGALYVAVICFLKIITRSPRTLAGLSLRFAYSLVPIAIAYHFAHYAALLLFESQALLASLSDPFALGWDLFGTAGMPVDAGIVGAEWIWYSQCGAILIGHIIATYVAHRIALQESGSRRVAGQVPMLALMVFYTVFGLWILAQANATLRPVSGPDADIGAGPGRVAAASRAEVRNVQ